MKTIKVYDSDEDEASGAPYVTMDLVLGADGEPHTLSSLHKERKTTEAQLLEWYKDLADAFLSSQDRLRCRCAKHRQNGRKMTFSSFREISLSLFQSRIVYNDRRGRWSSPVKTKGASG